MTTTDHSVLEGGAEGQPPKFLDEDENDVTSVGVSVAENSPTGSYVGAPLLAVTDPDGQPIYSLEDNDDTDDRDDTAFFELVTRDDDGVVTRQLKVKAPIAQTVNQRYNVSPGGPEP